MTKSTTALKGVDREAWRLFKAEAAKHGMTMGEFFSEMVKEHAMKETKSNWDAILGFAGIISGKDAGEMRKKAREIRTAFSLRGHDTHS